MLKRAGSFVLVLAAACGPDARRALTDGGGDIADARSDAGPTIDGPPAQDTSQIYAHSGTHLYQIDATDNHVIDVAAITGVTSGSITDIAIDKDGNMFGVSFSSLYTIDKATGVATLVALLPDAVKQATSLSFVPTDLNDPSSTDILVTATSGGDIYQLNTSTAAATLLGNYGTSDTQAIVSSGDLIAVRGLGILATVTLIDPGASHPDFTAKDFLATINPATWRATLLPMQTGFDAIFGLGFWGGKVYGFVDEGSGAGTGVLIEINPATGASTLLDRSNIRWFGAGVSTDAPIVIE